MIRARRSPNAFANWLERHLAVVYSAARDAWCGDSYLAEEVAQSVFHQPHRRGRIDSPACKRRAAWLYNTRVSRDATVRTEHAPRAKRRQLLSP